MAKTMDEAIQDNLTRYKGLIAKYRVAHGKYRYDEQIRRTVEINPDDYDVIVEHIGVGYGHTKYRVVKNAPALDKEDLALICDGGNLCFGYRTEGGTVICVYTD